jgi:hypothetical protein
LQRRGVNLVLGRGRLEIEQRLDVAAHLFFSLSSGARRKIPHRAPILS